MRWWPWRRSELEVLLGVLGLGSSLALWLGAPETGVAWLALVALVLVYFGAQLVRLREAQLRARFIENGALEGQGYSRYFAKGRTSLLVMHVDDDPPGPELIAVYSRAVTRGVEIRRLIVRRPGHDPQGLRWLEQLPHHPRLKQALLPQSAARSVAMSFAVVDESVVLLAVPGSGATDSSTLNPERLILRHLLVLSGEEIAAPFVEVYERLWQTAEPVAEGEH